MSQKRQPEDQKLGSEEDEEVRTPDEKRPKLPSLRNVVLEAWRTHAFQKFFSSVEPLIRRVVKEEVEMALKKHLPAMKQNCEKQIHPSTSRSLQLKFKKKLSLPVFTNARIEGEEGSILEIVLVDALTENTVNSGPESSAKIELVALEGDFEGDEACSWTIEEFQNNIVKEREGKKPLLSGDVFVNLNEGNCVVNELVFTDNSSWTRSRKFRLGARIVDNDLEGVRVREAKSEAFMVKDHRGELYKKHYPPSLVDDVWRLEKIGKDGAFHKRLTREKITTVKDFLTLLNLDAPMLRTILGTGMSSKMWEVTLDHARTCILDKRMFVYYAPSAQQGMGVVFNIVGQALGLHVENQFVPIDGLSETEKDEALKLIKLAYDHWEEVHNFENAGSMGGSSNSATILVPSTSTIPESSYTSEFPDPDRFLESDDTQPSTSASDIVSSILSMGGTRTLDNYSSWQGIEDVEFRYDHPSNFQTQITNSLLSDMEPMTSSLCSGDFLPYFDREIANQSENLYLDACSDLGTAVSGFLGMPSRSISATVTDKAKTSWTMLFTVLRWRFSIKRIIASKKNSVRETERYGNRVLLEGLNYSSEYN